MRVEYSHHCFSQDPKKVSGYDPAHIYTWAARSRRAEPRVFCPLRYADSLSLPPLVENLNERNVYPTRHHNHFAVKRATPEGHYTIWFRVEPSKGPAALLMVIESAYVRLDMDGQIARATPTKLIDVLVQAASG
ncbi:hypothetical protein DGN16_23050 [Xanthomonas citri pv. fuscans]|nr:hypothetical protein ST33_01975 [Xanthomonas citri pv. fuscans]MBV6816297.1 hypothetical protein [Xanthomonas campestris pv. passiflorae]QWN05993.1 hypothetical protein DGN16_23050 [Xanthomonas citri pv. fuscans]